MHLRSKSEPVSPINILAGCKLNIKNPKQAPQRVHPITTISVIPCFAASTERHAIIIIDMEAPSPSIPSVKFIALVAASITKIAKGI